VGAGSNWQGFAYFLAGPHLRYLLGGPGLAQAARAMYIDSTSVPESGVVT